MEIIKNLVQTLIIIVILAVFLDMLLPAGQMKPYVKMVMGLLIIIAVLQAIGGFLQQNWIEQVPAVSARPGGTGPPLEEIMAAGKQLQLNNQDRALEKYRQGISDQVLSLARLSSGVRVVDVDVEVSEDPDEKAYGKISYIYLTVDPSAGEEGKNGETTESIQPVHIRIGDSGDAAQDSGESRISSEIREEMENVKENIAGFYNLSPDRISINYIKN